jgi:putative FmdB family regulatory protein
MPLYEYGCRRCGLFSESRPMSGSAMPAPCPTCGAKAPRVLSATAVGHSKTGNRRRARGYREPALVKNDREPLPQPRQVAPAGGRPWMLGH